VFHTDPAHHVLSRKDGCIHEKLMAFAADYVVDLIAVVIE